MVETIEAVELEVASLQVCKIIHSTYGQLERYILACLGVLLTTC